MASGNEDIKVSGQATFRLAPTKDEVRVTDPVTGGEKGSKLAELGAICPVALLELAKVAGFGGKKYSRGNYLKGYRWSLSVDALFRHTLAWLGGEDKDPESGINHMAHAAWNCLALVAFQLRGRGTDDRFVDPNCNNSPYPPSQVRP